jgi:hypothetical protein
MLRLLQDIACDVESAVGPENPLRQVIVNTHSPTVVMQVADDSLLVAESKEIVRGGRHFKGAHFGWLPGTWRANAERDTHPVAKGKLLAYLNPVTWNQSSDPAQRRQTRRTRVVDRSDFQDMLPYFRRGSLNTSGAAQPPRRAPRAGRCRYRRPHR